MSLDDREEAEWITNLDPPKAAQATINLFDAMVDEDEQGANEALLVLSWREMFHVTRGLAKALADLSHDNPEMRAVVVDGLQQALELAVDREVDREFGPGAGEG